MNKLLINKATNQSTSLIYDVQHNHTMNVHGKPNPASIPATFDDTIISNIDAQNPLFFKTPNTIKIPNKVEYAIRKHLASHLNTIHPNKEVAKEYCLLLLAQLNQTHFDVRSGENPDGWKRLKAEYLQNIVGGTYKKIIEVLNVRLKHGFLLEVDSNYSPSKYSRSYRLGEAYRAKGISTYQLTTKEAVNAYRRYQLRLIESTKGNSICENLMAFYTQVELPTIAQIEKEASRLIKQGYQTKKGKYLKRLNKHPKSYYVNTEQYSFVEDSIAIFRYLTEGGLMVPMAGGFDNGGRIVDSFVLMPSWIRRLVKVDGKTHVEADYSCLHPNIAVAEYGGTSQYLTHQQVAEYLNTDVKVIKLEHLSFFNEQVHLMKQSPLWNYYQKNEPVMLNNIVTEKQQSYLKHKATSRVLFAKEVSIMTEVIKRLNEKGVYVGYVYDALFCSPKNKILVCQIMNEVAKDLGVYTEAKLSGGRKYNQLVEDVRDRQVYERPLPVIRVGSAA